MRLLPSVQVARFNECDKNSFKLLSVLKTSEYFQCLVFTDKKTTVSSATITKR